MTRFLGVALVVAALFVVATPALLMSGPATAGSAVQSGRIIRVPAGGDLQAALNAAQPGSFIELPAGATFVGNFVLPYKEEPQWIVIYSSAFWRLPPPGAPLTPAHAALMPRIVSPNESPAIQTAWIDTPTGKRGAHHYAIVGVEVTTTSSLNFNLIWLKTFMQATVAEVPTDIIFYRCYIHGTPTGDMRRGIALNGARMAVIGSYLSDFHSPAEEAQAIMGWNGPGPYWIIGNYLEAAGVNVMFGGGEDPTIPGLVPADIEIRGNRFAKPLSWREGDPSYAGARWVVKNLFTLKNARRVLVDGNVFEQNWSADQHGFAITFTPRNQGGHAPWSVVEDVVFTNNIIRRATAGIALLGWDNNQQSEQAKRILIRNNLFVDLGIWPSFDPNFTGTLFWMQDGAADVVIDHNTALHTGNPLIASMIVSGREAHTGFVFTNNITQHNRYGVVGVDPVGNPMNPMLTRSTYFPSSLFLRNVLVGGNAANYPPGDFPDTFFPAELDQVGFVDYAGGDYRLAPTSPYRGLGTDGMDIGVDMTALEAALLRWW